MREMNNDCNQNGSLCAGDHRPDVTESILLQKFSFVGPVYCIQLCRDTRTSTELQYAVVTFEQQQNHGERTLDVLIFDTLMAQPLRITWSQQSSSLRESRMGKGFIKNLEQSVDSMPLYDTVSTFGNVLSFKPVCVKNESRGLGYVHSEKSEADAAIKRTRMLINGQHLFISDLKSHQEVENKMNMMDVNNKQVDASQVQKKEVGHLKHQFEQRQNPIDNYTSIQQDKPHSSMQDIQLQRFQNTSEVTDPSWTTVLTAVSAINKKAVPPAVPTIHKIPFFAPNLDAVKSAQAADLVAVPNADMKTLQPAAPTKPKRAKALHPVVRGILKKAVPGTAPAAVKKTVSFAVPIAVHSNANAVQPAVPSIPKGAAPAAAKEALPPAIRSILKKAFPGSAPAAVKKTVSFAVPVAVHGIENAVHHAVFSKSHKAVPAEVQAAGKNTSRPAVPKISKRAVPAAEQEVPRPEFLSVRNKEVPATAPRILQKAVPSAAPAAFKKTSPFAGPVADPGPIFKKVVQPAVSSIPKRTVPGTAQEALLKKAGPSAAPAAFKKAAPFAGPVAVPDIKKAIQPTIPTITQKAIQTDVPAAHEDTLAPVGLTICKRAVPAAEQDLSPSIHKKAVSATAVKKAALFARPVADPAIKKVGQPAVSTIPKRAAPVAKQKSLPSAVPSIHKKAVLAADPAAVKKATPLAVPALKNAVQTAVPATSKRAALSAKQKAPSTAVPCIPQKAVPAPAPATDKKHYPLQSSLQLPLKMQFHPKTQLLVRGL